MVELETWAKCAPDLRKIDQAIEWITEAIPNVPDSKVYWGNFLPGGTVVAKKDGEHPESDDLNISDENIFDSEGGSDALDFSATDGNASNLFDFSSLDSSTGSALGSSLDLASLDDESTADEPLDLEEPMAAADSGLGESLMTGGLDGLDDTDLGESLMTGAAAPPPPPGGVASEGSPLETGKKGKKAKAKKETAPKQKKEKAVKEKKAKEPKVKTETLSDQPGFLVQAKTASPYTVMLVLSLFALVLGVLLLFVELFRYGFETGPKTAQRLTTDRPVAEQTFDQTIV